MSNLLEKYLKQIGVKSYTDLNVEEMETYKRWSEALAGRRLTDADVAVFLDTELSDAVGKVTKTDISSKEDSFLKMKIEFITNVKKFLATPEVERKIIEQQLTQQLS